MPEEFKVTWEAARVNAGLQQQEAAKFLGISKQTLLSYEKYRTFPNAEMILKMSGLYRRKVDYIFLQKPVNLINA